MVQVFDRGNIDEINKFSIIHQNYAFYLLAIANAASGIVLSVFYLSNFSLCQFINIFPYKKFTLYNI